jgi:hypothetical protein
MKILEKILWGILIFIGFIFLAFFVLKYNPKPEIITLDRRLISEQEIDNMARNAVAQMTTEEKVTDDDYEIEKYVKIHAGNGL